MSSTAYKRGAGKKLPLPPFGAAVLDAVLKRQPLNTYIIAGPDAWNRHRSRDDKVVLPPDASPYSFDWSIFRGQEPTIIADDADAARITDLIGLLLRAGAKLICVVFVEDGQTHFRHFRNV
jgi:hypothetical protein